MQRVKRLEPEEIARKIQQFDQELCTQGFLSELKPVLPSPEQVTLRILFLESKS
jgi:cytokinesis protein